MADEDAVYAGDVSAADAWEALKSDSAAVLVDVRTQIEWTLIGTPDLESVGKEPIYLQWVTSAGPNKNFVEELRLALAERNTHKAAPIYFMCQSGGRSKIAASQCSSLGYLSAYNVSDGFEGDLDNHQHRNSFNGWKASGLPWVQQ
ncbi:MAG: rhodanese-like domain-containing protein [Pseudomonadota bacterium]|nr:rhodanese-like domain-containing protein [Pseudomonadota bacterium]